MTCDVHGELLMGSAAAKSPYSIDGLDGLFVAWLFGTLPIVVVGSILFAFWSLLSPRSEVVDGQASVV